MNDTRPPLPMWPTLGQTLDYLRGLGFTVRAGDPGYIFVQHPTDDSWFVFREGELTAPTRAADLVDMKWQLPGRGFVSDEEFAQFWNPNTPPVSQPEATTSS